MQSYMPVWKPYHKLVRCVLGSVLSKSSSVVNLHGFVPAMYSCVVQFPFYVQNVNLDFLCVLYTSLNVP